MNDDTIIVDRPALEMLLVQVSEQHVQLAETKEKLAAILSGSRHAERPLVRLKDYAFRKGISCEAARKRAKRGGAEKRGGAWYFPA